MTVTIRGMFFELLSFDRGTFDFETGDLLHSGKHPGFEGIAWCSMVD